MAMRQKIQPTVPKTAPESPPAGALWRNGWYGHARQLASPNFGARSQGALIDLLVIHSISLPPGEFGNGNVQRLFTNRLDWDQHSYFQGIRGLQVSAHFFVARTGELWQFVSCDDRAWHAGQSSYRGRTDCNDDSIGIELEGLEGGVFEAAQYETLAGICSALLAHYPVAHIAGHEHIAPGRKADPGAGFDWPWIENALAAAPGVFPRLRQATQQ
jgi:N-acetyl-anhydromuramoyl-L-alanine amidase